MNKGDRIRAKRRKRIITHNPAEEDATNNTPVIPNKKCRKPNLMDRLIYRTKKIRRRYYLDE
jgi:hypothetical protein